MARKLADPFRPRHSLKRLDVVPDPTVVTREGEPVLIPLVARVPHLVFFQSVTPEGDELEIYYEMVFMEGRSQIEKRTLEEIIEKSREEMIPTAVFRPEPVARPPTRPAEPVRERPPPGVRPPRKPARRPPTPAEFVGIPPDILRAVDEEALFQSMVDKNLSYDAMARIGEKLRKSREGEEGE